MNKADILRFESDDSGTYGNFWTSAFECYTLELPWRDLDKDGIGDQQKSCITAGTYRCVWAKSPKYGECYHVENVKGRSNILIHAANWAGDESKGLKCQLLGCIAPGRAIGPIAGQKGVMSSKDALAALEEAMGREPFELTISWADEINPVKKA